MGVRRFSGERLREARESAFLSQRELAQAAGVSHSTIAKMEAEGRQPQMRTVRKIGEALKVQPATLYEEIEESGEGPQEGKRAA